MNRHTANVSGHRWFIAIGRDLCDVLLLDHVIKCTPHSATLYRTIPAVPRITKRVGSIMQNYNLRILGKRLEKQNIF